MIDIAKSFVATTDEVYRLDTEEDSDCRFFQVMADHGHYGVRKKGKSRQGIYVFTAQGEFLSSINSLSADAVLKTIKQGLAKWQQLPESEPINESVVLKPKHRWEDYCPRDKGLVLNSYSRDLMSTDNPNGDRSPFWNRDSAWFSEDEALQLIPEDVRSGKLMPGDTYLLPDVFVSRICRIHLVDAVKGQTEAFAASETVGSKITATVVERTETLLKLKLSGNTKARHSGRRDRGVETTLRGSATFDFARNRFTEFEFVALGNRWGATQFNDRRRQLEKTPIGYTFNLATPDDPIIVPGIFWAYNVSWIPRF